MAGRAAGRPGALSGDQARSTGDAQRCGPEWDAEGEQIHLSAGVFVMISKFKQHTDWIFCQSERFITKSNQPPRILAKDSKALNFKLLQGVRALQLGKGIAYSSRRRCFQHPNRPKVSVAGPGLTQLSVSKTGQARLSQCIRLLSTHSLRPATSGHGGHGGSSRQRGCTVLTLSQGDGEKQKTPPRKPKPPEMEKDVDMWVESRVMQLLKMQF